MDTQANYCMYCGRELVAAADQRRCPRGCPPDWPLNETASDGELAVDMESDQPAYATSAAEA
jgi:hypothetical protein